MTHAAGRTKSLATLTNLKSGMRNKTWNPNDPPFFGGGWPAQFYGLNLVRNHYLTLLLWSHVTISFVSHPCFCSLYSNIYIYIYIPWDSTWYKFTTSPHSRFRYGCVPLQTLPPIKLRWWRWNLELCSLGLMEFLYADYVDSRGIW